MICKKGHDIDGRIILKWILEWDGTDWIYLAEDRDNGNEPLDSIKFWEILEWLSDQRLFKKDPSPWG
jgi:hypothetical protein